MIVTLVFGRRAASELLPAGSRGVRVAAAEPETAVLKFDSQHAAPAVLQRTARGAAAVRLSARSGALLVNTGRLASGDRLVLERTSYRPVAAHKAASGSAAGQALSARICISHAHPGGG